MLPIGESVRTAILKIKPVGDQTALMACRILTGRFSFNWGGEVMDNKQKPLPTCGGGVGERGDLCPYRDPQLAPI
jgi:hypothetical protein